MQKPSRKRLKLGEIRLDYRLQSRVAIDLAIVDEYSEAIRSDDRLPAVSVVFDKVYYYLVDGFHRLHATKKAGIGEIDADVVDGTFRDALLASVGANVRHGLRRSNDDKRRAVMTLLTDSEWSAWSDNQIAKACGVSATTVGTYRGSLSKLESEGSSERTYRTKHGTEAVMKTGNIGRPCKSATLHAFDVESDSTGAVNGDDRSNAVPTEDRVSHTSNKESFEQFSAHASSIPCGIRSGLPKEQPPLPNRQLPNRQPLAAGGQPVTHRDAAVTTDDENDPRTVAGFHKLYNHAAWTGRDLAWYQEQFRKLVELTGAEDEAEVVSIVRTLCAHVGTL